jgi:hypothetical protein
VAALAALCLFAVIWQERPRRVEPDAPVSTG